MDKPSGSPRRSWPAPVLVSFWLVVILVIAAGVALVADRTVVRSGASEAAPPAPRRTPVPVGTPVVAGARAHPRPTAAGGAAPGVVMLGPAPAASATLASTAPGPTTVGETSVPAEVLLREVPTGKQTRSLNCEFQTASDLAWYYGLPLTWEEIFQVVGHDPGGNPHKGFAGRSFDDRPGQVFPQGYGVYAEPIAQGFAQLGIEAAASYNNEREWLMEQLAAGRPVMVWTTAGMAIRPVATWTTADGSNVKGVPGEHTYLAVGYNPSGVWLLDPYDGKRHHFEWPAYLASWDLLDRMALVVTEDPRTIVR